ncbi:MAG TPA: non-canonical purine NTP pyrophosphatase [Candidatus Saccharimonadales bacterium]|nr:non-canonical purine NTP pyrophosphatase [Candidatus Saccharimonadales bacterium]
MKKLLIATTNPGKVGELSEFLKDLPVELVSLADVGIDQDVEEDGETYQENAEKKAKFYAKLSGLPAVADDGGLEIDALDGEPGIHSRRWLGYTATDQELVDHMIKVSEELPDDNRKAQFVVVDSLALPTGEVYSEEAAVEGIIAEKPLSKLLEGYPYRSFFYLPKIQKYYHESELTDEEMKQYNHRYRAIQQLKFVIKKILKI